MAEITVRPAPRLADFINAAAEAGDHERVCSHFIGKFGTLERNMLPLWGNPEDRARLNAQALSILEQLEEYARTHKPKN